MVATRSPPVPMRVFTVADVLLPVFGSAVPEPMLATLGAVPVLTALTTRVMAETDWPAPIPPMVQVTALEQVQPAPPARTKVVLVGTVSVTVTVPVVSDGPALVAVTV